MFPLKIFIITYQVSIYNNHPPLSWSTNQSYEINEQIAWEDI